MDGAGRRELMHGAGAGARARAVPVAGTWAGTEQRWVALKTAPHRKGEEPTDGF